MLFLLKGEKTPIAMFQILVEICLRTVKVIITAKEASDLEWEKSTYGYGGRVSTNFEPYIFSVFSH